MECYAVSRSGGSSPSPYSTQESPKSQQAKSSECWGKKWQHIGGFIALGAVVLLVLGVISHWEHISLSDIVRKVFTYAGAAVTGIALLAAISCCCRSCLEGYARTADKAAASLKGLSAK